MTTAERPHDHDHETDHDHTRAPGVLALIGALLIGVPIYSAMAYEWITMLSALQLFALAALCFAGCALLRWEEM